MNRCCCLLLACMASMAWGEIVIDRTRLIYPAAQREVTVHLTNRAPEPRLVQVWMDAGDAQARPEFIDVPFSVTPPIVRMEPNQRVSLRVFFHPSQALGVASDHESVYWLNVLGIAPAQTEGTTGATVQFAFRSRIKVFLRPVGLEGSAGQAPSTLQWRLIETSEEGLLVHNPSAFHVSLSRVELQRGEVIRSSEAPPMLGPSTTMRLSLSAAERRPGRGVEVRFTSLDDYGVPRHHTASPVINPLRGRGY
ncbi:fimbria/pilus periplasmic chaperone [Pseudomonas syringae]|nr:fimbria/pilus periplasmic chaperone [Pseudomonas syringae]